MFKSYDELITFSKVNMDKLIVLDFKASWCAPCKALKPFIDYLQIEYPNVIFQEIDIEDEEYSSIINSFTISKLPSLIYIKNGIIHKTLIGTNKENIENTINEYL